MEMTKLDIICEKLNNGLPSDTLIGEFEDINFPIYEGLVAFDEETMKCVVEKCDGKKIYYAVENIVDAKVEKLLNEMIVSLMAYMVDSEVDKKILPVEGIEGQFNYEKLKLLFNMEEWESDKNLRWIHKFVSESIEKCPIPGNWEYEINENELIISVDDAAEFILNGYLGYNFLIIHHRTSYEIYGRHDKPNLMFLTTFSEMPDNDDLEKFMADIDEMEKQICF